MAFAMTVGKAPLTTLVYMDTIALTVPRVAIPVSGCPAGHLAPMAYIVRSPSIGSPWTGTLLSTILGGEGPPISPRSFRLLWTHQAGPCMAAARCALHSEVMIERLASLAAQKPYCGDMMWLSSLSAGHSFSATRRWRRRPRVCLSSCRSRICIVAHELPQS